MLHERLKELLQTSGNKETDRRHVEVLQSIQDRAPLVYRAVSPVLTTLVTAWAKQQMGLPPG